MIATIIYFISCHGGPAAHFAEFARELKHDGYTVEILATGPAFDKLKTSGAVELNPSHLDLDSAENRRRLARAVAKKVSGASTVLTDVGHLFLADVHKEICHLDPTIRRLAYYDNPESYVPGGYSETAAKVMTRATQVLFANSHLATEPLFRAPGIPVPLAHEKRIGLGFFPTAAAYFLKAARSARHEIARRLFLEEKGLADTGQKILLYLGGNNEVFFKKAFPGFLHLLREARPDPSEYLIVMQHHPGSQKREIDTKISGGYPIFVSNVSTEEALLFADAALYYQTSMGPQIALAGIPAIQVGHKTYPDILVRNHIAPSATTKQSFLSAIASPPHAHSKEKLLADLGICKDWASRLREILSNDL